MAVVAGVRTELARGQSAELSQGGFHCVGAKIGLHVAFEVVQTVEHDSNLWNNDAVIVKLVDA